MRIRGQAAAEFVIILGVSMAILSFIWYLTQERYNDFQENVRVAKAENSAKRLKDAVDFVYRQGAGAKTRLYLTVPEATDVSVYTTADGTGVAEFFVHLHNNYSSVYAYSYANLTGEIPNVTGSYCIDVISLSGVVNVTRSTGSC